MSSQNNYYEHNESYSQFLSSHEYTQYSKYVDSIIWLSRLLRKNKVSFLDVGSGTGQALELLQKDAKVCPRGIEISRTSLARTKEKGLRCFYYDGSHIPYSDMSLDIVGSFNVLEHTQNPMAFLDEQLRVLKKGGFLLVVCPNFLALSNNYHAHTRGYIQKVKNALSLCWIWLLGKATLSRMEPTHRPDFQPDDDAINVTNPISLLNWAKLNNLELVLWSSQEGYSQTSLQSLLDRGICRAGLGALFMIFKKK